MPGNPFVSNEFLCAFCELADASKSSMKQAPVIGTDEFLAANSARAKICDAAMTIRRLRASVAREGRAGTLSEIGYDATRMTASRAVARGYLPSLAMRCARRETLRLALFLCTTPR